MRKHRYSRQWLVSQGEDDSVKGRRGVLQQNARPAPSPAQLDILEVVHVTGRIKCERQGYTTRTARSHLRLSERSGDRFYQILEVLLAIVLVNFLACRLTDFPMAVAAFGYGAPAASFPSHNLQGNFGGSHQPYTDSDEIEDPYYRQAHSIGGSAFGYNGLQLQHNLDDNLLRSQNFKISPKPCSVGRIEGTCMFVWECIKSEGRHVGMCVDSFMFGSCCAHNYTDNIVLPNTFSYTRPTKPIGMGSMNHRPRPPQHPHKPSIIGMTTIERPHGAGTLVIRPSGPHHQGPLVKPQQSKPSYSTATGLVTSTTTDNPTLIWTSSAGQGDLQSSASISSATTINHQQHWHLTTEPNFITKPRPPAWDKPGTFRPKPPKPSKKPIMPSQTDWHTTQSQVAYISPSYGSYFTRKPTTTTNSPTLSSTTTWKTNATSTTTTSTTALTPSSSTTTTSSTSTTTTMNKTKPQFVGQNSRPTTVPASSFTYAKPTSSSSAASTTAVTTPISTSSPRPQSSSSTATTTTAFNTKKPATTTMTTATTAGVLPTKTTTQRPTSSSRPYTTTSSTSPSSALHTLPATNISAIESNEIADNSVDGGDVIKTVSAARSECGVPVLTRPETRIVGGKSAAFGRWPWQVSVRRTSFFGFSSTHRCGGALINENWIATAGHCVDDLLISQIRIRVGEYDFAHVQEQLPYIERGVSKKIVHPQYNFFTYEYDLALVKMEQPLEFAPHVSPICLPETDSLLIGMNATVTGWGRLSEGGTLPSVLQEVSVPIVSNDNCKSMFLRAGRQEFIPEIFLCAGYENGGQDSCQGDSGGPLQVKSQNGHYFLAGIISWGIGCAEANLPGVCTRISKFVPWIMENVT